MKHISTPKALDDLNTYYDQFLQHPKKRKGLLKKIEDRTDIVCADPKVIRLLKINAKEKLDLFRGMMS